MEWLAGTEMPLISVVLNLVLLLLQQRLNSAMGDLKVYMHQNFQPITKR